MPPKKKTEKKPEMTEREKLYKRWEFVVGCVNILTSDNYCPSFDDAILAEYKVLKKRLEDLERADREAAYKAAYEKDFPPLGSNPKKT